MPKYSRAHTNVRTHSPALRVERLEDRWVPATLFVDDSGGKAYTSIQAAVDDAVTGDEIVVFPGVYRETVTVPAETDNLLLRSSAPFQAIIQAPAGTGALVRVQGADGAEVRGFTITGNAEFGVQVDEGGSARIDGNRITGIRPAGNPASGFGVFVGGRVAEGETPGEATVTGNTILGYQTGGVFVSNPGSAAEVTGNTVVGSGPSKTALQYGITVGFGADAVVTKNTVSGNSFAPAEFDAAGIYVVQAGIVAVDKNTVFGNELGILVEDTDFTAVTQNQVTGNRGDGIVLSGFEGVFGAVVEKNTVSRNGGHGIVLESASAGNLVTDNKVTLNAGSGLFITEEATGNTILGNDLRKNSGIDAVDQTGPGANFWFDNKYDESDPEGL